MAFRQSPTASGGDHRSHRSAKGGYESDLEANGSSSRISEGRSSSAMRPARSSKRGGGSHNCCIGFNFAILCVVAITFLGSGYIGRALIGFPGDSGYKEDFFDHWDAANAGGVLRYKGGRNEKKLRFGQGFRVREGERDSRDWDSDDRDRSDTVLDDLQGTFDEEYWKLQQELQRYQSNTSAQSTGTGLPYERGRKELDKYEQLYYKELNSTDDENGQDDDDYENEDRDQEGTREVNDEDYQEEEHGKTTRPNPGASRNGKSMDIVSDERPVKYRRRHRGGPCEISFIRNITQVREPQNASKFSQFELSYVTTEDRPAGDSEWRPKFAGHQSWEEREKSFHATDQTLNCGFVRGTDPVESTGFDLAERDLDFLATCHIAVSSCIFGKSDKLHTPRRKMLSSSSKKEVCFVLFVDQSTLEVMINEGQIPDKEGYVGLWRVVLVKNLPYSDFRLVGKIPKFLSHRLFPSAKYSIWLDSKLRLQSDPLSILEYFLWRGNHEYAISNHYQRHCVWDEVQQNKRLNKFNHSLIDEQFHFYQSDGLVKFNASDPKRLLPSYVPEGSFIVRAHTPMSNLFSCLWFNEVERFTPRDQLSFAYTYMKLVRTNPGVRFRLNMFKDCERRMIAKLFRHRQSNR